MEFFDLYDVNRIPKGKMMKRGEKVKDGDFRLAVHICVFSSDGRMLVQKRQTNKAPYPDLWDLSAGGSAIAGETSAQAAERELFEETGLKISFADIRPHLTVHFDEGFNDLYLVEYDAEIGALNIQQEEVQEVKWASEAEILAMIEKREFVPYYPSLISLLFAKRRHYGCRTTAAAK